MFSPAPRSNASKPSPGSESRSSSPHQTPTPSRRTSGQSLHPGHLSAHKCALVFPRFRPNEERAARASFARRCQREGCTYLLCTGVSVVLESSIRQDKPMLLPLQRQGPFSFSVKYNSRQRSVSPQGYRVTSGTGFVRASQ